MLRYEAGPSENLHLKYHMWDRSTTGKTELYEAPMPEFDLLNMKFEKDGEEEVIAGGIAGPSIFIVIGGEVCLESTRVDHAREYLKAGQVVFVKPAMGFKVKAVGGKSEVWGAFVEA